MAVDLGSTFKELIDEINSKSAIDSIDGLKGGTLSSPLKLTGGDQATAAKISLSRTGKGQITDESTRTVFGFMSAETLTVGSGYYVTNIRGNANSTIDGKKFSDLAVKGDIPDTSDYVKLTTDQTISGTKTFTSGNIIASKTDTSNKTMKVAYGPNGIAYTPYGTTSIHLISFPAKDGTFALTSDIPSLTNYVTVDTAQTITGIKTFNAPTNVSGKETITTKFKTSNGGALIIGKEGQNSGTMLRFDQVDGTCRLRFRASATAGAMVWEQPEKNAALYFDMGNSTGSGKNRVTLRNVAGTLALTKEIPAAVSANPTLSGSETELTGLQIGNAKYKIPTDYVKLSGSQKIDGVKTFGNLSRFNAGIDLYGTLSVYKSISSFAERTDYKYNVITSYVPKNNTTNTYTSYKISFPTSVDSATAINLPTKDGTIATQEYVTEQIGNIDILLAALNNGTGV